MMGGAIRGFGFGFRQRILVDTRIHAAVGFGMLVFSGCASWHERDADREVGRAIRAYEERVLGSREAFAKRPTPQRGKAPLRDDSAKRAAGDSVVHPSATTNPAVTNDSTSAPSLTSSVVDDVARELSLAESLRLAFHSSREWHTAREQLYRTGLDYTLSKYTFGPILDSTVSYLWNYNEGAPNTHTVNIPVSVRQILPLGGSVTGTAGVGGVRVRDGSVNDDFAWSSDLRVNLQQPLLRGAGYEVSHESLTQSEQQMIYAVREFELFRQDLSTRVAREFYQLVSQRKRLENDEQNYRDAVYDRNRAESLRQLDRNKPDDVFQARRREIQAETELVGSRTNFRLQLDNFRILLGLPASEPVRPAASEPPYDPRSFDAKSAVEAALSNRLDLHTRRDRVADAERSVRVAKNTLLPELNLTASYGAENRGVPGDDATPNQRTGSAGVELGLPLDRKSERNAYRSSLISLAQARRDLEQAGDEVERDVLNALRELSQFEKQIELQREQIASERRAVAVMQIRVESGEAQQRDLTEARQSLNSALNSLIDLTVEHFVANLRLMRTIGVLFVDPDGMWQS